MCSLPKSCPFCMICMLPCGLHTLVTAIATHHQSCLPCSSHVCWMCIASLSQGRNNFATLTCILHTDESSLGSVISEMCLVLKKHMECAGILSGRCIVMHNTQYNNSQFYLLVKKCFSSYLFHFQISELSISKMHKKSLITQIRMLKMCSSVVPCTYWWRNIEKISGEVQEK